MPGAVDVRRLGHPDFRLPTVDVWQQVGTLPRCRRWRVVEFRINSKAIHMLKSAQLSSSVRSRKGRKRKDTGRIEEAYVR